MEACAAPDAVEEADGGSTGGGVCGVRGGVGWGG